jgi:hypothetical protein
MGQNDTKSAVESPEVLESPTSRRRRRHGYRGYPLSKQAGGIHFGQGFSGVESGSPGASALPRAGIFTEESTRRSRKS